MVQFRLSNFDAGTRFQKLKVSLFTWHTGRPGSIFWEGVSIFTLDLFVFADPKYFLPSTSHDHGTEAAF